jgi:tetratricopeptide (TPR) repeat protein
MYICEKQWPAAEKALQDAVTYDPTLAKAWFGLGYAHYEQHDYAGAVPPFEQCISVNGYSHAPFLDLIDCLNKLGRYNDAVRYGEESEQNLYPNDPRIDAEIKIARDHGGSA